MNATKPRKCGFSPIEVSTTDNSELPDNWEAETEYLNGNAKLVAQYKNNKTGERVTVSPYKTYEIAGFCNTHIVRYWTEDQKSETVAKGLHEAEYVDDAKAEALEKMKEVSYP